MSLPQLPSRFRVNSLLGAGGSGRVFHVHDAFRDRALALKVVTAAEITFLRHEFETLRQIRHENLIQVFDWGTLRSGEAYYTMELVEGEDWSRRMGTPHSDEEARRILTGLSRGLAHLHSHGEIHGDLKPGNILLGKGGTVKVTDVGMGGRGETKGMSGTPGYAAPECWEGARPDVRSDIYSVGVMAYEALVGKHPFAGRSIREVVAGQLKGWVPSPATHGVRLPADLERTMMRALERDPRLRHGSSDEFMEGMGIKDRVGTLVPGGFVNRERELKHLAMAFPSSVVGGPTMCVVVGEKGVGRGSVIREFVRRSIGPNIAAFEVPLHTWSTQEDALSWFLNTQERPSTETSVLSTEVVSKQLRNTADKGPLLFWSDTPGERFPAHYATCGTLARYAWASAIEEGTPPRMMFLFPSGVELMPELYQTQVSLGTLGVDSIGSLIQSILGRTSLPHEFVERVARESSGSPELAIAIIQEAIERSILVRRDGTWRATQTDSIEGMRFTSASSHYLATYLALPGGERLISAMLALLPGRLTEADLARAIRSDGVVDAIARLTARGWIISRSSHLKLASDSIGEAILDSAAEEELQNAAESLACANVEGLAEVDLADLALRSTPSLPALRASLSVARRLIDRGDVSQAIPRLRRAAYVARSMNLSDIEADALLMLVDAEHRLGHHKDALALLRTRGTLVGTDLRAAGLEALRLEAGIASALGDYARARDCLEGLIAEATSLGDTGMALDSHAQLAELDWTRGDEAQRSAAIERIRSVLERLGEGRGVEEQKAALTYGLGSALIRAGRREEAAKVLEREYGVAPTDYWRMRIANALASANYYLTNVDTGLSWTDRALEHAERASADALRVRILSNRAIMLFGLGRIREAAEEHTKTAALARRVGNRFEYASACVSSAADLVWLARYEEAIRYADETVSTAAIMSDLRYQGKGLEVKAYALILCGDLEEAEKAVQAAQIAMEAFEYIDCRPRIDWHRARIHAAKGEFDKAEAILAEVERGLLVTRDLEDLWGVQIELHRIRQLMEPSVRHLDAIRQIAAESDRAGIVVVYLAAAVAFAAGALRDEQLKGTVHDFLTEALPRSERAGTDEMTWQILMSLGKVAGDLNASKAHFTSALRTIRLIADRLSPRTRHHYLASPTVMSGLSAMS